MGQGIQLAACALSMVAALATASPESSRVQSRWDQANFALAGDEQATAMASLVDDCEQLEQAHPDDAELLTWCGIAHSSYAGLAGPLSAMKYAKAARASLERALVLDPGIMKGAAKTSLGVLYYKVPGWPIGFGDDDRARELLEAGLAENPLGMDSNYFYADFLLSEKNYEKAREHLQKALDAPPRQGRSVADAGRRQQIVELLADIERHAGTAS